MRFNPLKLGRLLIVCAAFAVAPVLHAADAAPGKAPEQRDAQTVINQMRLKRMTQDLSLTPEQQKKIEAIFSDEAKQIAQIQQDENLNLTDKYDKQMAIKKKTNEKITPLLTDDQRKTFEELLAKAQKKKKKRPGA